MADIDDPYDDAGVATLRAFIERTMGGKIVRMERQLRWRPAWFVDVERGGVERGAETLKLHLRGDRGGGVSIFPDLKREADVIELLDEGGVPVPHIHGYCAEPPAILMDAIAGTRDISNLTPDELAGVGRDYMAAVAAMHQLPLVSFVDRGIHRPEGAEAVALVGLTAYLPHYQRTKAKPEPLLEFAIRWLRRNVPTKCAKPAFIQFDSGQFLVSDGRMTGLYDFEFSMIGDPMVDIATMRMRDSIEPLPGELPNLIRHYEALTGVPVDHHAIEYHTLQFATLGAMQFAGFVARPTPGEPHSVYLEFDIALRQVILHSLATLTGIALQAPPRLPARAPDQPGLVAALNDAIAQITPASEFDESRKTMALHLVEWLGQADSLGVAARAQDLAEVSTLLGRDFADWHEADAALEAYVLEAGAKEDAALIQLFNGIEGRAMQVFGPTAIGHSASHVSLPPTQ